MRNLTLYTEGGPVQAKDGIYLTRDADDELLSLCRKGQFSYVLAARQIGKTSLMIHAAEQLAKEDIRNEERHLQRYYS